MFSTDGTAAALDVLANMPDDDVATLEGYVEAWRELVGHDARCSGERFHAALFIRRLRSLPCPLCIHLGHEHDDA